MIEAKVGTRVTLLKAPTDEDWKEVNRRARTTVGYTEGVVPSIEWRHAILRARHSPIRYLRWSFLIEDVPYWVACELRTHVHDMPYDAVERAEKAYIGLLVPMCGYCGGICHEMKPCGRPWRIYHD